VLENAIKHTPREAALTVASRPVDDGYVRLSVEDAGPGVPDEALARLFDKLYRPAHSRWDAPGRNFFATLSVTF